MVIKLRSALGGVLIWLLVVAGVSATAWFAIDRAGRGLTGAAGSLASLSAATALGGTPGSSATPTAGAAQPSGAPSFPLGASGTGSEPTESASAGASPSADSGSPSGAAGSTNAQDRTLGVAGGQVSMRCTGATILLRIATPDNGWRVEVGRSGPQEVALKFERGEEATGGETHVKGVCVNGAPSITVDNQS